MNNKEPAELHNIVARGLFDCNRLIPDIQLTIEFMNIRVIDPDKYDYFKIKYFVCYLKGTQYIQIILIADNTNLIKWYIYKAHSFRN